MQNLKLVSEDQRRKLFEFGEGEWKIAKYLEIKEESILGNHFHKQKDECFFLIDGEMEIKINEDRLTIKAPAVIDVPRGTFHVFYMNDSCRLIGLCSELFNQQDDHSFDTWKTGQNG